MWAGGLSDGFQPFLHKDSVWDARIPVPLMSQGSYKNLDFILWDNVHPIAVF